MNTEHDFIFKYTRAEAIADGVLYDVSTLAKEAGYKVPVAVSASVWGALNDIPEESGQDLTGRLWDLLIVLLAEIRSLTESTDLIRYRIILDRTTTDEEFFELKALSHGGDDGEHVLTIMQPEED